LKLNRTGADTVIKHVQYIIPRSQADITERDPYYQLLVVPTAGAVKVSVGTDDPKF
jgi:hypothetical protein